MIVLISESLLLRVTATDGRILRTRSALRRMASRLCLIFLGNFVADISTANGTRNRGQCFTVTGTELVTNHATNQSTHTNSNRTILSHRLMLRRWNASRVHRLFLRVGCQFLRCHSFGMDGQGGFNSRLICLIEDWISDTLL
ncbi:MAG: hypothetical protein RL302_469 [Pseudomonadota bacterium]